MLDDGSQLTIAISVRWYYCEVQTLLIEYFRRQNMIRRFYLALLAAILVAPIGCGGGHEDSAGTGGAPQTAEEAAAAAAYTEEMESSGSGSN